MDLAYLVKQSDMEKLQLFSDVIDRMVYDCCNTYRVQTYGRREEQTYEELEAEKQKSREWFSDRVSAIQLQESTEDERRQLYDLLAANLFLLLNGAPTTLMEGVIKHIFIRYIGNCWESDREAASKNELTGTYTEYDFDALQPFDKAAEFPPYLSRMYDDVISILAAAASEEPPAQE